MKRAPSWYWAVVGWALLLTTWGTIALCWWAVNGWRWPAWG